MVLLNLDRYAGAFSSVDSVTYVVLSTADTCIILNLKLALALNRLIKLMPIE